MVNKKGMSLLVKGIYIIMAIVLISIFINRIFSLNAASAEETRSMELRSSAMNDLSMLDGNEKCLALKEKGKIEDVTVDLSLHNVIDVEKLNDFSTTFSDTEPICARDYKFGYRVRVETLPINISSEEFRNKTPSEKIKVDIPSMIWEFGSSDFSKDNALKKKLATSISINVYFNESTILPGRMAITIVDGEMEKFLNAIEQACSTGKSIQFSMFFSYPTYLEKNSICMDFLSGKNCQRIGCEIPVSFAGIKNPGNYKIDVQPSQNLIKVIV